MTRLPAASAALISLRTQSSALSRRRPPAASVSVSHRLPITASSTSDCFSRSVSVSAEGVAAPDVVDVHEDAVCAERAGQMIEQPPGVPGRVVATVADEYPGHAEPRTLYGPAHVVRLMRSCSRSANRSCHQPNTLIGSRSSSPRNPLVMALAAREQRARRDGAVREREHRDFLLGQARQPAFAARRSARTSRPSLRGGRCAGTARAPRRPCRARRRCDRR